MMVKIIMMKNGDHDEDVDDNDNDDDQRLLLIPLSPNLTGGSQPVSCPPTIVRTQLQPDQTNNMEYDFHFHFKFKYYKAESSNIIWHTAHNLKSNPQWSAAHRILSNNITIRPDEQFGITVSLSLSF